MKNNLHVLSALLVATLMCGTLQADGQGARKGLFWGAVSGATVGGIAGGPVGAGVGALTVGAVGAGIGGSRHNSRRAQERKNDDTIDRYEHKINHYQTVIANHQRSIDVLNAKRTSLARQKSLNGMTRSIDRETKQINSKIKSHENKINRLQSKIKDLERKIDRLS
jgi:outer membrane lipoprotein SlyB